MHDVFISYSREDLQAASAIADRLSKSGFSVFFDQEALVAGESFSDQIGRELQNSRAVLVLLSSNSRRSSWVAEDLQAALDTKKLVIPVLMDQGAKENWLWPLLATRQGFVLNQNSPDWQAQLTTLVQDLARALENVPTDETAHAAPVAAPYAAKPAGKPSMWIIIAVAVVSAVIGAILTLLLRH